MEELATYDPSLVVGILGGGSGTLCDTFELVRQAENYGARLALFGRKINSAEHQPSLVTWLRAVAEAMPVRRRRCAAIMAHLQSWASSRIAPLTTIC